MVLGWPLLIATFGSSIWVFFDAPRHGLSRLWSLACLVVWVFAFPTYLIARAEAEGPADEGGGAGRDLRRWLSHPRLAQHRRVAVIALAVALPLTVFGVWELRLLFRGPYMLFLVRHPALSSIPLIAGATAFLAHLALKLARRMLRRRTKCCPPEVLSW